MSQQASQPEIQVTLDTKAIRWLAEAGLKELEESPTKDAPEGMEALASLLENTSANPAAVALRTLGNNTRTILKDTWDEVSNL